MKHYENYSSSCYIKGILTFITFIFWIAGSLAATGNWANGHLNLTISPEPGHWSAQSSLYFTWSLTSAVNWPPLSGYQYQIDNEYSTSTPGTGALFTNSTSIRITATKSGVYYFHLWAISTGGKYQQPVTTVGPMMIDLAAPDTTDIIPLPDVKLPHISTTLNIFNLADYATPSTLPWDWQKESTAQGYEGIGISIQTAGKSVSYTLNPADTRPGQERILFTAGNIINSRSIVQVSDYLWNKPFPPFVFKEGKFQSPSTFLLRDYYELASSPSVAPLIQADSIFSSRLKVKVNRNELQFTLATALNSPASIKMKISNPYHVNNGDTQILWAYENLLENGDFSEAGSPHWVYQYSNPSSFSYEWKETYDNQSGVLKYTQWNQSQLKWVQNLSSDSAAPNPFIPVHGGSWYTLRARLKTNNPASNQSFTLEIDGYAGYGGMTSQTDVAIKTFQVSTTWNYYEVSWYARTNLAAVVLKSQMNDKSTSTFFLDEVDFIEKIPDAIESEGKKTVSIPNSGFDKNLSGWAFQRESGSLQANDTSWLSTYKGRKGICAINPSGASGVKLTQFINLNPANGKYKFRVWCATDAASTANTPYLILVFNTFDAKTQAFYNVMGNASFSMRTGSEWYYYDFACPVEEPVLAVQVLAKNLNNVHVYLDEIELIKDPENPMYWNHEKLDYWEPVQIDTSQTLFFQLADSKRRFVPVGGNLHVYAHPFGINDNWWNPYSEDSFSPLWLDMQMEAMEKTGCNAFKLIVLIHDILPDADIEFGEDTVSSEFPSIQTPDSIKIPSRYLDRLDQIIAMARRHHLRVILTLPFNYQTINWWLKNGGNYGEGARQILARMWAEIVSRYRDDPSILSYSLNVEQWIQMREWADTSYAYRQGPEDYYFKAPVTENWQEWLVSRYTTINNLNTAWSQIPAPFRKYTIGLPYSSFTEIPIPGWDGQNTIGSSSFTGGAGGGEDTAHFVPMAPVRLDNGSSNHLIWRQPNSTDNLVCYYLWRQEKGKGNAYSYGTTWHLLNVLWDLPTTYTDNSESFFGALSSYRYEVTGGNPDSWRSYPEATPWNENAAYDPMLYDFIRFREYVVDGYNYAQTSTIRAVESDLDNEKPEHLTSLGLAQFNYLYRWPSVLPQWGDGASMTPEGPQMTLGFNMSELPKSMDFQETSFYTGFPLRPWTSQNQVPGVSLQDASGKVDESSIKCMLQYLRLLLRWAYWNPEADLRKPILLKEFAGEGEDLYLHNLWNNLVLDYTRGETAGWMVWYLQDSEYGLWDASMMLTPWGKSLKRRADDLKNDSYSIITGNHIQYFDTDISTTSNWMFLLTSSDYRDEEIPAELADGETYYTLGTFLKSVREGDVLPSDHWDIQVKPDPMILRKPEF
jgi:hypothetical protein